MLSTETESRLAKLFLTLSAEERAVDTYRSLLNSDRDFNAFAIFCTLDSDDKSQISPFDIQSFLRAHKVFLSSDEVKQIISFYDANCDGSLNYLEFSDMLVQSSDYALRRSCTEKQIYEVPSRPYKLNYNIEYMLARLLEREVLLCRTLVDLIKDISFRFDFDTSNLFNSIDRYGFGYASVESLNGFLKRNGHMLYDYEFKAIFKRIDLDRDDRITFPEFRRFFEVFCIVEHRDRLNENMLKTLGKSIDGKTKWPKKECDDIFEIPNVEPAFGNLEKIPPYSITKYERKLDKTDTLLLSEENLIKNLKEIINHEQEIEQAKIDLVMRSDFDIKSLLSAFEIDDRGFITEGDIKCVFEKLGIFHPIEEISLLIRRYNRSSYSVLNEREFWDMICPKDITYATKLKYRQKTKFAENKCYLDIVTPETKYRILKMFNRMLECESCVEGIRQKVKKLKGLELRSVFEKMDTYGKGELTAGDLVAYFKKGNQFMSLGEVEMLLERFDKDKDGRINYDEFVEELSPKSLLYFP